MGRKRTGVAAVVVGVACALFAPLVNAQSSASFRMDRITFAASAEPATSANFAMSVTFAQEGPVGSISRCNVSFLQNTGFWSILGESPVPVLLQVARDGLDPSLPALAWSGSSSEFTLYRAAMSEGVVDPFNETLVTDTCAAVDTPPPAAVTYYVVLPSGN